MKIIIDNKTYEQSKLTGKSLRVFLEVQEHLEHQSKLGIFKATDLDMMVDLLVIAFGNEFTSDDVLENLDIHEIMECFQSIDETISKRAIPKIGVLVKK